MGSGWFCRSELGCHLICEIAWQCLLLLNGHKGLLEIWSKSLGVILLQHRWSFFLLSTWDVCQGLGTHTQKAKPRGL